MKMNIFDIKSYRERHVNNTEESGDLEIDRKVILDKLYNEKGTLKKYVTNVSRVSSSPYLQVFYELLQNAQDAGADTLYIYMSDDNFLVVNNGEKFNTIPDKSGNEDLWSFLSKDNTTKDEKEDAYGEFGRGSKLLYTLLVDASSELKTTEKVYKELVEKHNSIILFSWDRNEDFLNLRNWDNEEFIPTNNSGKNNPPILCKLLYSFYPVAPFERKKLNGKSLELFPLSEVKQLKSFIDEKTYRKFDGEGFLELTNLDKGSLLFLRLGNGAQQAIQENWDTVKKGISTALNFFADDSGLKRVVFNGEEVIKEEMEIFSGSVIQEENTIPFGIAYYTSNFLSSIYSKKQTSQEINIYRLAPTAHEKYGLWLYINANFELMDDRQRLKWETYNNALIKKITDEIVQEVEKRKTSSFSKFWYLYQSILFSNLKKIEDSSDLLKVDAINYMVSHLKDIITHNIPTENKQFLTKEQVRAKKSKLTIPLKKLGVKDYQWAYVGESEEHKDIILKAYNLKDANLADVILNAEQDKLESWIQSLAPHFYPVFIEELENVWNNEVSSILKKINWILASDGNWYSLNIENDFWVLDKRIHSILNILKTPLNVILSDFDFSNLSSSNLRREIEQVFSNSHLFNKLNKAVEKKLIEITPEQKVQIINLYETIGISKEDIASLPFFENKSSSSTTNNYSSLNTLVERDICEEYDQLIPNINRIQKSEDLDKFEPYRLRKPNVFKDLVVNNWTEWIQGIGQYNSTKVSAFYEMVQSFYKVSTDKNSTLIKNEPCIYTANNNLKKYDDCISIKFDLAKVNEVILLVKKLDKTKAPVHPDIRELIDQSSFFLYQPLRFIEIIPEKFTLSLNELLLLKDLFEKNELKLFQEIYIEENSKQYSCYKRTESSPRQVDTTNSALIQFLSNHIAHFRLLPKELRGRGFDLGHGLIKNPKILLTKLLSKYSFQKAFADSILELQDQNLIIDYLNELKEITLITNFQQKFKKSDFEYQFIELATIYIQYKKIKDEYSVINKLKRKIKIIDKSLDSLIWNDDVTIEFTEKDLSSLTLSLSKLLPKYQGISNVLSQAISCFPQITNDIRDTLFESKSMPANEVASELNREESLSSNYNLEHFIFMLGWLHYNSKEFNITSSMLLNSFKEHLSSYINLDKTKTLSRLKLEDIYYFNQYTTFNDWVPERKALVVKTESNKTIPDHHNQFLLSEQEILPEWVVVWISQDSSKVSFLKRCGIRLFDLNHQLIKWRLYFSCKTEDKPSQKELLAYWGENTLEWVIQKKKNWDPNLNILRIQSLSRYIEETNEKSESRFFALSYDSSQLRYELILLDKDVKYGVFSETKEFEKVKDKAIKKALQINNFQLLVEEYYSNSLNPLFQSYSIYPIATNQTIDEQTVIVNSQEWGEPQYSSSWKEKHGYEINLHPDNIPSIYKISQPILFQDNDFEVDTLEEGEYYFPSPEVYLSKKAITKYGSVEKLLRKLVDYEGFTMEALLDLYAAKDITNSTNEDEITISAEEKSLIDLLIEKGITTIEELKKNLENNNKGKGDGGEGDGRVDVPPVITTGHQGEIIIYHYLKCRFPNHDVIWASKDEGQPAYDFRVQEKNNQNKIVFYFDAKTTGKSDISPDSIPFYVKSSQLQFLANLKVLGLKNYILVRLNLNDMQKAGITAIIKAMGGKEDFYKLLDYEIEKPKDCDEYIDIIENNSDFLNLSKADIT